MSGGSFNYLCFKNPEELVGNTEDLERMVGQLADLGYAEDAAKEAEQLLCLLRQAQVRISVRQDRLQHIFRAMEWWRSGDTGEDGVRQALAKYRSELEAKESED